MQILTLNQKAVACPFFSGCYWWV